MNIPSNITNPKTLRKWERHKKEWDELVHFAKENGCTIYKRSTNSWSFRKDLDESPYGFDTEGEVYLFIKKNNANTGII